MASEGSESTAETRKLCPNGTKDKDKDDKTPLDTQRCYHLLRSVGYSIAVLMCVTTNTVSSVAAQALGGIIPPLQLNLLRYTMELLLVAPPAAFKLDRIIPERKDAWWLLLLCFTTVANNVFYYQAFLFLPVGTGSGFTNGLILIATGMVAMVVFKNCSKLMTLVVVASTVGLIFLVQPDFIFQNHIDSTYNPPCIKTQQFKNNSCSYEIAELITQTAGPSLETMVTDAEIITAPRDMNQTDTKSTPADGGGHKVTALDELVGYSLILADVICITIRYNIISNALPEMHFLKLTILVSVFGIVVSAILMAIFEKPSLPSPAFCTLLLFVHVLSSSGSEVLENISLTYFQPPVVALAYSLDSVFSFVAQYTFMRSTNPGKGNIWEIIGAVIVVVCNVILPVYELRMLSREQTSD